MKPLLGKAMDPAFWQKVREKECYRKFREELLQLWDARCASGQIRALKYSEFAMFFRTGNRSVYEAAYFEHRLSMDTAALLSLIWPEEDKYLTFLMDILFAVCDEYTWCLPAHQKQLDKNDSVKVDLFASETGFALSEIDTMLGDRLDPLIRARIRTEIDRRIVVPMTSVPSYSWWENGTSNWTAVCMGSVGCTLMLMHPELVEQMKPRMDAAMEKYLSGFRDDGMCMEGCGYWHYGFGFFVIYADMIRTFTEGKTDYFVRPKVKTIAGFIQKMYLSGRSCVSFADGGRTLSFHLGLVHYLKREYPGDVLAYSPEWSYNYDGCGRFCLQLRSVLWLDEEYYEHPDEQRDAEYFAPESGWFIKKTPRYGFAAKGGCNAELHNHNDVGTFIFAKNGRQMIMDLGSGIYTRQYFSDDRYSILQCASRGHNVPLVGGEEQFTGEEARAVGTAWTDGTFRTEISGAYRTPGLEKLLRSFTFTGESVTLNDEIVYSGEGNVTERFVSYAKPEAGENCVLIDEAKITCDPAVCPPFIHSEKTPEGAECWFVDYVLPRGTMRFTAVIS